MKKQNLNNLVSALNQKSSNEAVEAAAKKVQNTEKKMLQITIEKELHNSFKAKAAIEGKTMTQKVEQWIAEYLSNAQ